MYAFLMNTNEKGLLLCCYFIMSSPELRPNRFTGNEDKNKSRIELHAIRCWSIDTTTAKKVAKIGGEYQPWLRGNIVM